ncbi:MAG: hypothetical protein HKN26_13385 [Acidimicrobiales bacterium]|nr:hypothetical protein [Acidimicrobiales bacterium]
MTSTMSDRLHYSREELLASHEYAEPHVVAGRTLHGGFLADGRYQPPRALVREPAMAAWEQALAERGGQAFPASAELLSGIRVPNTEQHLVLLRNGIGDVFWNSLTIIGKIEAMGANIVLIPVPDLQAHIVEDVSGMAIGHLGGGLFEAHGIDEGGVPSRGIGGHDAMWFAARDLAFGPDAFPDVDPQPGLAREDGERYLPEIPLEIENLFSFLANLLIIEFRAEIGFAETQAILRSPDVFTDRRAEAELAAEIIERIRIDEGIHVRSLNLYLGELCSVSLRTLDGGSVPGSTLVDRFWDGMVRWATVTKPARDVERALTNLHARIAEHPESDRVRAEFDAVGDA